MTEIEHGIEDAQDTWDVAIKSINKAVVENAEKNGIA